MSCKRASSFISLFVALGFIAGVLASPVVIKDSPIKIPLVRHLNLTGTSLIKSDQARAKHLKTHHLNKQSVSAQKGADWVIGVGITNAAVSYTAQVNIGTPGQVFNLLVDTGSANTWVGAGTAYQSSSGQDTGEEVFVEYGSGLMIGEEFIDTLSVGSLTIPAQSFGVAELAFGFDGVDGILGVGPTDLTIGTTSDGEPVDTVTDNAVALGLIPDKVLGVYFQPPASYPDPNGVLTFGGIDSSKPTGSITVVPITSTSPASNYVGIDQTVNYGSETIIASSGIVDTGTTLILLATDTLNTYVAATGAVFDDTVGLYNITTAQYDALQSLFFTIGDTTFEFTKNAQIWPRTLNTIIGGDPNSIYLIVGDLGSDSGSGLDFINGMTFLERFYTVYDSGNQAFGIATTAFTTADIN